MNTYKMGIHYLNEKPIIGIISGFSSGILLTIQGFLTDESILKIVAGLGAIAATSVAIITLVIKLIEVGIKFTVFMKSLKKK